MRYQLPIVALTLGLWLLVGISPDKTGAISISGWTGGKRAVGTIQSHQLKEAIKLSAGYLIGQCRKNGEFLYRINVNPAIKPKPRYNLLRHAGTIYALAFYDQAYPQTLTRNTLKRATDFFKDSAIAPIPGNTNLLAVWSHPEITRNDKPLQAKLGGTGLGLVALLSVEKRIPGTTPVDYLRKMGNFLLFMQKNDGGFYSKYIPEKSGRDGRTTPTATRLEGLLTALNFLPADYTNLRQQMVVAIDEGMQFLLRSQIQSGKYAGGIPRAVQILPEDHPHFTESFNRRATEVRIDYVQHALSAMLQYERMFF